MKQAGSLEASIFMGGFVVVIVFALLNILLAIIMSSYYAVAEDVASSDTLIAEVGQAYERWLGVRRGDMVPMLDVASTVKQHRRELRILYDANKTRQVDLKLEPLLNHEGQIRLVTVEFLRNYVLKMRTSQARELLESTVMWYNESNKNSEHNEQMRFMMHEMDDDLKMMRKSLEDANSSSDDEDETEERQGAKAILLKAAYERQQRADARRKRNFSDDVARIRGELKHASLWIGDEVRDFARTLGKVRTKHEVQIHELMLEDWRNDSGNGSATEDLAGHALQLATQLTAEERKIVDELVKRLTVIKEDEEEQVDISLLEILTMNEKLETDIDDLKVEILAGKQRSRVALDDIAELEPVVMEIDEETTDVAAKFHTIRQQVAVFVEERHRIQADSEQVKDEVDTTHMSRAECFELVHSLSMENDAIKHQLETAELDLIAAGEYVQVSRENLKKLKAELEPQLEEVRKSKFKAAEALADYCSGLLDAAEDFADLPNLIEQVPEVVEILDYIKHMHHVSEDNFDRSVMEQKHLSNAEDGGQDESNPGDDIDEEVPDARHRGMMVKHGGTIACL